MHGETFVPTDPHDGSLFWMDLTCFRPPRSMEKLVLPVLRNPARSNQRRHDTAESEWDGRHDYRRFRQRRRREPKAQLAFVYLPPVFPIDGRHGREYRATKTKSFGRHQGHGYYSSSDESSNSPSSDEEEESFPQSLPKTSTMRSQRMRSLAAMSKLQHDAAATIQREYRLYRRRQASRNRRNQRLARQAQAFLDVFLLQEVTSLVPVCLLDVLRETRQQEAATTKRREDLAASLAEGVLTPLIDECIRDVFHDVLQAMVKSYLVQRIDLSRAATPTADAVAADILNDWTKELAAELLPEVLAELTSEYSARQQQEEIWEELLHDELQAIAAASIADSTPATSTLRTATASQGSLPSDTS